MVVAFMVERSSRVAQPEQFIYCWGSYVNLGGRNKAWAQSFYPGTVFRFIISHATHGVNLAHIDSGSVDWWAYYLNAVLCVYLANCHTCILAGQ